MSDENLSILIRAILEKSSKAQIETEIEEIQQKLNKKPLEIKIDKKALEVLQALVEVNKKISSGIEQATSKLSEQTKHIQNEKLEVNKLSNAYGELGKKIKTIKHQDANRDTYKQSETYKNLAGVETTVHTTGTGKETGYTVVNKDKSLQQEQLEFEKRIGDIQNKNFNEAKEHLTQIRKLRQDYYKLNNKDTEEAQELRKQLSYHQSQYNNIVRRKIDIGDKTKIEGIEAEKLNQLEKIREQTLRNISNIKAKSIDKGNAQQQKQVDDFNKKNINGIDMLIQKREQEAQQFSKSLQAKMQQEKIHQNQLEKINAEQSKYWSQRVKETVGDMTRKPDELIKMADYYKQLESSSNDFNKKNINAIDYEIQKRETLAKQFSQSLQAKMLQETEEKKITTEIHKQNIAQEKMLNTIRGMRGTNGAFITGDNLTNLNALESKIKGFNPADKNFSKNMRDADLELKKINTTMGIYKKEVQDASKFTGLFGQSIFEAGKKFASWLLIGNTIMGAIRVVRDSIQFVADLDNAMNQLRIVMNLSNEDAVQLGKSYNALAKEMSVTTTEIAKAAVEYARQGLSLEQMDNRLRNTIKYAKISGMEFQEAAEIITASVNSMGIETERAVDIFSYMGDATATGKHMCPAA